MTTVYVANIQTDEMSGDSAALPDHLKLLAAGRSQRMLWFARDGDVLVAPVAPKPDYVEYVTALTGVRASSLRIVVPPPGHAGERILTADRLADEGFLEELRRALAGRPVDLVR